MLNKYLEEAYNNCFLLKVDIIKNELVKYLKGYILVDRENQQFVFSNLKGEKLNLEIGFNYINIIKFSNQQAERIRIDEDFIISEKSLDKRENGIVLKNISKIFTNLERFQGKKVLTDIFLDTYLFTKDKLESLISYLNYKEATPMSLLVGLRLLETRGEIELKTSCDYHTEFKSGMNYYYRLPFDEMRTYKESSYSSRTYLNGEDVSLIYDIVDGEDKISRIYDLYNGIITKENEEDINAISLGLLRSSAFDLKTLSGIREKEDCLVGKTLVKPKKDYLDYVKEFLLTKYNYNGKVSLDRETIMSIITRLNSQKEESISSKTNGNLSFDNKDNEKVEENGFMKVLKKTFKRF